MHILIAEDQASSALILRRLLEKLGHEVTVASHGLEAWEMFQVGRFSVVISDWVMPVMDGIELCQRIRARDDKAYTYIILLTSKREKAERLAGLRAGADDFLIKPPDADELAIRLEIAGRILAVQEELERRNALLAALAESDELTGAKNRRHFLEALDRQFARARRDGSPLSLLMLDIDQFKAYNDSFGHPAGDDVLRTVARLLREHLRGEDVVARIGGEEFVALLPEIEAEAARAVCERIGSLLRSHPWRLRPVTASLGVSTASDATGGPASLIEEADRALYASKRRGRDRATHHLDLAAEADDPAGLESVPGA